jgi:uncharacterized coiled-coil protein SlyX
VKVLRSEEMVRSHANDSDTEREPKMPKVRDRLSTLEKMMDQLTDAMCTHGEKVERHEARMSDLMARFNETIKECQEDK